MEYPACVQHEALINMAFEGRGLTILCPYDTAHLGPRALVDARMTHPVLWPAG
ncbi:MAG TPA: MEDS domain-containing protein, partial [Mycobacterium sp.]